MKNNKIRRCKYCLARSFGATRNQAEYVKDLNMEKFETIMYFLMH